MQKYLSDTNETNLRLPGPVPVPKDILNEQTKPLINHRGKDYSVLLESCTDKLKKIFFSPNISLNAFSSNLLYFSCLY